MSLHINAVANAVGPAGMDRVRQLVAEGHRAVWLDNGMLMLLGADTAERLLKAPEVAAPVAMIVLEGMSGITSGPLHELWSELMFGKDGDEHRELRDRVAHELTPKAVERLRPHVVEHADGLLDRALAAGVLEVHDEYALPLRRLSCWASPAGISKPSCRGRCDSPTASAR